jgi:hypothetical protein
LPGRRLLWWRWCCLQRFCMYSLAYKPHCIFRV